MASPQLENGHTRIANELYEALTRVSFRGCTRQVLDVVIRKTYGFNKKRDHISISQFQEGTGLSRRAVIYALQELEAKRIILVVRGANQVNELEFNKDYDTWVVQNSAPQVKKNRDRAKLASAKLRTSAKLRQKVVQNFVKKCKSFAPTKDNIQNTITKEIPVAPKDATLVNLVIESFKQVNPSYRKWFARPPQREAASRLVAVHGVEQVQRVIKLLPISNTIPYFPTITTPLELEDRWAKLEAAWRRKKNENDTKKTKIAF